MRTTKLAGLAARAEGMRLRRVAKRYVYRAVYAAIAAVFFIAVLVGLHVLAYQALFTYGNVTPFFSVLIVLGFDLVVGIVFIVLAMGVVSDPVEAEAKMLRDQSLNALRADLATFAMVRPLLRLFGRRSVYGMALATLTARFLSKR